VQANMNYNQFNLLPYCHCQRHHQTYRDPSTIARHAQTFCTYVSKFIDGRDSSVKQ